MYEEIALTAIYACCEYSMELSGRWVTPKGDEAVVADISELEFRRISALVAATMGQAGDATSMPCLTVPIARCLEIDGVESSDGRVIIKRLAYDRACLYAKDPYDQTGEDPDSEPYVGLRGVDAADVVLDAIIEYADWEVPAMPTALSRIWRVVFARLMTGGSHTSGRFMTCVNSGVWSHNAMSDQDASDALRYAQWIIREIKNHKTGPGQPDS